MAHQISQVAGKSETFQGNNVPAWHGLGTTVEGTLNSKDALKAASLDWSVSKTSIDSITVDGKTIVSNTSIITRPGEAGQLIHLGTVGKRYVPIQNEAAFSFFDSIIGEGHACYETAGALFQGKKVWIQADIPASAFGQGSDETKIKVLLTNSHDGEGCLEALVTPVRVVCWNTYSVAIRGVKNRFRVRHLENWSSEQKIIAARQVLGITKTYGELLEKKFEAFRSKGLTKDAFVENFLDKLFVLPEDEGRAKVIMKNRRDNVIALFENGAGNEGKTVWDGFNAITEWANHGSTFKETEQTSAAENRFSSILDASGRSFLLNQEAFEVAQSLVA